MEAVEFTGQDIFDLTLGVMNEMRSNSGGYREFFLPILNAVLNECLPVENGLRLRDGREELTVAPFLHSLEERVDYHRDLIQNVIPYGVGTLLFLGDDENVKATYFSSRYDENRQRFGAVTYVETEDVY